MFNSGYCANNNECNDSKFCIHVAEASSKHLVLMDYPFSSLLVWWHHRYILTLDGYCTENNEQSIFPIFYCGSTTYAFLLLRCLVLRMISGMSPYLA